MLVIAGDFITGPKAQPYRRELLEEYTAAYGGLAGGKVFSIEGNHEFYGRKAKDVRMGGAAWKSMDFDLRDVGRGRVSIQGNTGWTDFCINAPALSRLDAMAVASGDMPDYRHIYGLTPRQTAEAHYVFCTSVEHTMREFYTLDYPWVCVSHHAPSRQSLSLDKGFNRHLDPAYASDLSAYFFSGEPGTMEETLAGRHRNWGRAPRVWIHGHIHDSRDYTIGETRIVANPRGYVGENPRFDPLFTIDVA